MGLIGIIGVRVCRWQHGKQHMGALRELGTSQALCHSGPGRGLVGF